MGIDIKKFKNILKIFFAFSKRHWIEILVILSVVAFSVWLMCSTFGYYDGKILIKNKLYSDFLSHISLIRSFSMGDNFPPEYPHFAGVPIRYHFLFYALVGIMEKMGIRIDLALNLLSVIGFAGLLLIIFYLAKKITKSKFIGIGAILTIIFNPSLSWIYYFFIGKNTLQNFSQLFSTSVFGAFGPYDDKIISAFWNLNVYTNQRHLAFSFLLMFIAIWFIIYSKGRKKLLIAILIIGIMSLLHKAVLMITFVNLGVFFLAFSKRRKRILVAIIFGVLICLPGLFYLSQGGIETNSSGFLNNLFVWQPGFLYKSSSWWEMKPLTDLVKWVIYWILNLGILPLISFAGVIFMIFSRKVKTPISISRIYNKFINPKTAWFISATIVFIIANLFNFGLDMATNHKLINFSIMIWGIYAFLFIKAIWDIGFIGKIMTPIWIAFLLFGGICDLFPIINDRVGEIEDIPRSRNAQWVKNNSKPKDVFLNLNWEFNSVTLNGRKLYLGVAYFSWGMGYPIEARDKKIFKLLSDNFPKDDFCNFLKSENISFFYLNPNQNMLSEKKFDTNLFIKNYPNGAILDNNMRMYNTDNTCGNK